MMRIKNTKLMTKHAHIGPLKIQSMFDSCIHVHAICNWKLKMVRVHDRIYSIIFEHR